MSNYALASSSGRPSSSSSFPVKTSGPRIDLAWQNRLSTAIMMVPLVFFLLVTFIMPIGQIITKSISNPEVVEDLPSTTLELQKWNGNGLPAETAFNALVQDMISLRKNGRDAGRVAKRLNFEASN